MIDLSSATIRKQTEALDELIKKPIHSISPDALATYETEYFGKKCVKSYEMIQEAKKYIPGGVQHNLAFNHPFPLVFTKAEGAYLKTRGKRSEEHTSELQSQ